MPEAKLMHVTNEQRIAIKKDVNLDSEETLQKCIIEILHWYKEQEHLPRIDLDPVLIEKFLIARKGSVDQAKQKIDSMFTVRLTYPELASPRDIHHPQIQRSFKSVISAPVRKLNHDNTRVTVLKYTENYGNYNVLDQAVYIFTVMQYRLKYDYSSGDRLVVDLKHKTWRHYTTEIRSPHLLIKIDRYLKEAFGQRIKGIHLINAPNYIYKMLTMFKMILPKKIMERIMVHANFEELYTFVDKDILPKDFGGNEKTLQEIMEDWNEELGNDSVKKYLLYQESLRTDESKRKKS